MNLPPNMTSDTPPSAPGPSWREAALRVIDGVAAAVRESDGDAGAEDVTALKNEVERDGAGAPALDVLDRFVQLLREHYQSSQRNLHSVLGLLQKATDLLARYSAELGTTGEPELESYRQALGTGPAAPLTVHLLHRLATSPKPAAQQDGAADQLKVDPVTGLPRKSEAMAAITRAASKPSESGLAVFLIEHARIMETRFGREVANEVMQLCSQHIATNLIRPGDMLFRWDGPAFVAVLQRDATDRETAAEIMHVSNLPTNIYLEQAFRTIYLPIRIAATTIALANGPASVLRQIDQFIQREGKRR